MMVRKITAACCLVWGISGFAFAGGYAIKTVVAGESLASIASRYNTTVEIIMNYNALTSEVLHPGDIVKIPYVEATGGAAQTAPKPPIGFTTHTLQEGETFSDVATHYGLSLQALVVPIQTSLRWIRCPQDSSF
jgi:LysM repeat protein